MHALVTGVETSFMSITCSDTLLFCYKVSVILIFVFDFTHRRKNSLLGSSDDLPNPEPAILSVEVCSPFEMRYTWENVSPFINKDIICLYRVKDTPWKFIMLKNLSQTTYGLLWILYFLFMKRLFASCCLAKIRFNLAIMLPNVIHLMICNFSFLCFLDLFDLFGMLVISVRLFFNLTKQRSRLFTFVLDLRWNSKSNINFVGDFWFVCMCAFQLRHYMWPVELVLFAITCSS